MSEPQSGWFWRRHRGGPGRCPKAFCDGQGGRLVHRCLSDEVVVGWWREWESNVTLMEVRCNLGEESPSPVHVEETGAC